MVSKMVAIDEHEKSSLNNNNKSKKKRCLSGPREKFDAFVSMKWRGCSK